MPARRFGFRMLAAIACVTAGAAAQPFRITVRDSATKRGVPLVECTTTNGIVHVTDSAGVIAFDEPGLMDRDVFFTIKSHGYTFPKDGFDQRGKTLRTVRGGSATLEVDRVNIAERLYRVTGQGIYRDSVLLGDTPPVREPVLNAQVVGQDSVQTVIYRGRVLWLWGDTARASYPLGNFAVSGATSLLPTDGGLNPAVGVDLAYFTGPEGFSRPMCPIEGRPGPVWVQGLVTCTDASGRERLLCHFARMKSLGEMYEQGIAIYNDDQDRFEPARSLPLDTLLHMRGQAVRHSEGGVDYWYFATPFPLVRCRAAYEDLMDPARYESFTCLKAGARFDAADPRLDRDAQGRLVYAWKPDTGLVSQKEQDELIKAGLMKPEEALITLRDAENGNAVLGHAGSVHWNDYRKRWIMIVQELWGTSLCGEVWYSEAPELTGPWALARKIVTHDDYSFYNVAHHPFFDQDGGRFIYFEGTYTMTFSGAKTPTARYDYNQIMYRLDLADPRMKFGEVPAGDAGK